MTGLLVPRLLVLVLVFVELHRLAALHVLAVVLLDLVSHGILLVEQASRDDRNPDASETL
jgi:hypothetical protein